MRIQVRYLGPLKEITRKDREVISVRSGAQVAQVVTKIARLYPKVNRKGLSVALNGELVRTNSRKRLCEGDEVVLIPPGSGGRHAPITVKITKRKVAIDDVMQNVIAENAGAIVIFIGRVRPSSMGKEVIALEYDVYKEMALKTLHAIASEAYNRFGVCGISVVHRVGRVNRGEIVLITGVSSIHRDDAYRASMYIIDELKSRAPIWKKEVYIDGEQWVDGMKPKIKGGKG